MEKHFLIFLPYRFVEETAKGLLAAGKQGKYCFSIICNSGYENYASCSQIKNVIRVTDEKRKILDEEALLEQLDSIHAFRPFHGVLNYAESHVDITAKVVARYGLPGNSLQTAILTRDKFAMRKTLEEHCVGIPKFQKVHSFSEFKQAVKAIGFPCISKPLDGAASDGVVKITENTNLEAAYNYSTESNSGKNAACTQGILVESYIGGSEISIEGVVSNGVLTLFGITQKTTEKEPFFNEIMHIHPAFLPKIVVLQAQELALATIQALGITSGGIHLEAKYSDEGMFVIECASRPGGDAIMQLVEHSKAINPHKYLLKSVLGEPILLPPERNVVAGIRFIQSEKEGTVKRNAFNEKKLRKLDGIVAHRVISQQGDSVGRAPRYKTNRMGYIIAIGLTSAEILQKLENAEKALKFKIE